MMASCITVGSVLRSWDKQVPGILGICPASFASTGHMQACLHMLERPQARIPSVLFTHDLDTCRSDLHRDNSVYVDSLV